MASNNIKFTATILVSVYLVFVGATVEKCLETDSISCLQLEVYRYAKDLLDKPKIELLNGVSITQPRQASNVNAREFFVAKEADILEARSVETRQDALEQYIINQLSGWSQGTLAWSPQFVEGRGKQKKELKMLLPLLIGIKLKLAALGALAYMGIALIAKKAVLAGLISLLISAFIAVKNLVESYKKHDDITPYHWEQPQIPWIQSGLHDQDFANSQTKGQLAYAGQQSQKA